MNNLDKEYQLLLEYILGNEETRKKLRKIVWGIN